ncbi:MAG: 50S ribosomal protein L35 [bacterium]
MPKAKTHKSSAKRFKVTGTGKVIQGHSQSKHIVAKKSRAKDRRMKARRIASKENVKILRKLMPYAF